MSLFFETKFVEANTDALKKNEKSLDTEKSRDEMSHYARRRKICMFDPPNDVTQWQDIQQLKNTLLGRFVK